MTTLQIHGPLYNQIVERKDLVVDTLPPPLYIVESYLATLELLIVDPLQRTALIDRFHRLQEGYVSKETEWKTRLPPGLLCDKLIHSSGQWARRFYELWHQEFLTAAKTGDTETIRTLVSRNIRGWACSARFSSWGGSSIATSASRLPANFATVKKALGQSCTMPWTQS